MTDLHTAARMAREALEEAHDASLDDIHFECREILKAQITALREQLKDAP